MGERHAGRLVAITGGSSGIGQAMVLRLVREGARVAILDVGDAAETVALAKERGGNIRGYKCDIGNAEQVQAAAAAVRKDLGDPNILIHCAALQFSKPYLELTPKDWAAMYQVNVAGCFYFTQAFLPAMR